MPDWGKRTLRTFAQAFLGFLVAQIVAQNLTTTVPDYDTLKTLLIAAFWAGVVATITGLHNLFEDATGKSVLK